MGPLVKVEHHPGQSIKLDRKAAEQYVATHPGTRILEDAPPAPAEAVPPEAPAEASGADEPEAKMLTLPENKARSMPKGKAK